MSGGAPAWHGAAPGNLLTLGVWGVCVVLAVRYGRVRRGRPDERIMRTLLALGALACWTASAAWYLMPGRFRWEVSLPIQLCELAGLVAPWALLSGVRVARSVLHFWALGLCTQAFITPVHEPGTIGYALSFCTHASVIGLAVYDSAVLGYRPVARDLAIALLVGVAYGGAMFVLDAVTGWNYGFVGPGAPGTITLVDSLGPWPMRAAWIILIAAAAQSMVYSAWLVGRWATAARREGVTGR